MQKKEIMLEQNLEKTIDQISHNQKIKTRVSSLTPYIVEIEVSLPKVSEGKSCVNQPNSPKRISTRAPPAPSGSKTKASPPSINRPSAKLEMSTLIVSSLNSSSKEPPEKRSPSHCKNTEILTILKLSIIGLKFNLPLIAFSMISMLKSKTKSKNKNKSPVEKGSTKLSMDRGQGLNNQAL